MITEGILVVFGVLAAAVVLFAWGRPRPDVVAILVVVALNLSGVLSIQESLAGFGQPVVVLIAAVSIVGEGLIATGVVYRLGDAVMKVGGTNEARLVALVMALAGTVGAFMSSSAVVAMFIPVVLAISDKIGLNRKRMLMPLSVAALVSGMMTLIASSPNMIVEDALRARGLTPLSFFSWTPFGAAALAAAIAFMPVDKTIGPNQVSRARLSRSGRRFSNLFAQRIPSNQEPKARSFHGSKGLF
jgi:di/tricarboxylate transporter